MGRRKVFITVGCVAALSLVVWLVVRGLGDREPPLEVVDQGNGRSADRGQDNDYVIEGGVRRRRFGSSGRGSDRLTGGPGGNGGSEIDDVPPEEDSFQYGVVPSIPIDTNPQVAWAAEGALGGEHPERVSVMAPIAPFDAEAFAINPVAYLETPEPGRVFQTAQPGPDVPVLARLGLRRVEIEQGESTTLQAIAPAGAPVTFSTFDLGHFQNQLTTVTVQSSDQGIAEAVFTATTGVIADVNIAAGSPVASGRIQFVVEVGLPE